MALTIALCLLMPGGAASAARRPAPRPLPARALARARDLLGQGHPVAARQVLEAAFKGDLLAEHLLLGRAELEVVLGRPGRAAALLARVQARGGPYADRAALGRADLLLVAGRFAAAARQYRYLRRRFPAHPDPGRFLAGEAVAQDGQGRPGRAAALWRRVLLRHPASPAALAAEAALAALRGRGVEVSSFSDAEQESRALRLGRAGEAALALALVDGLSARAKNSADRARLALLRAEVLLKSYRYREAVSHLDQAARSGTAKVRWRAARLLPRALLRGGLWKRLSRRRSAPGPAARAWLLRGEHRKAWEILKAAGRQETLLGAYLALRSGASKEAERLLGRLARQGPRRFGARYWLGRLRWETGRRDAARRLWERLATARPLRFYGLLARRRLRQAGLLPRVAASPVAPVPVRPGPKLARVVSSLRRAGAGIPDLQRAAALLAHGLRRQALERLRIAARDLLLSPAGGRLGQTLRPIFAETAWRSPGDRALPAPGPARAAPTGPSARRALWQAFVLLGDPYMAGRFARRGTDHPPLRLPRPYARLVRREAGRAGVAPSWVWAVMAVESAFCSRVVSRAGAVGLLQIMPGTARRIARVLGRPGFRLEQLFSPAPNIRFGVFYLGRLARRFGGQLALAAAAYNGGPHNVAQWLGRAPLPLDEFVEEIPLAETRRYVRMVVALAARYAVELGEAYDDLVRLRVDRRQVRTIDF